MALSVAAKTCLGLVAGVGGMLALWPLAIWYEVRKLERPKYTVLKKVSPNVEIRKYSPYLIAEVELDVDSMRDAGNKGFMQVAGYIFGKNRKRSPNAGENSADAEKVSMTSPVITEEVRAAEKVSMTSPVIMEEVRSAEKVSMTAPVIMESAPANAPAPSKKYKLSFTMPSKYTLQTLPVPDNANVKLIEVEEYVAAALRFKGYGYSLITGQAYITDEIMRAKRAQLEKVLRETEGIEVPADTATLVYQYYPPFTPGWLRDNEVLLKLDQRPM